MRNRVQAPGMGKSQSSGGNRMATANRLDIWLVKQVMRFAGNPRITTRLWDGQELYFSDGSPVGTMELKDRQALSGLVLKRQVGFGDGYSNGRIRIHGDLSAFMAEITRTSAVTGRYGSSRLRSRIAALRRGTLTGARDNIHRHYDLGNDFYRLWLDKRMLYTCAYYESDDATLDSAQRAKMEHVCRKLQLRPGQEVVEAGCGWGALSLHMARHYGVKVRAYNISTEQVDFAREQAALLGLGDRVEFVQADYRTISGEYDAFVSVGMLEHVGLGNYRQLGDIIHACLKPTGRGLIHSIGRSHPARLDPWIRKRIFPGAHVPSIEEMGVIFEPHRFSVLDIENLRMHYARTCADWLRNYRGAEGTIRGMYGDEFVRAWRLYLAGSSAAFSHGTMQLYQVVFAPHGNNSVPWTRAHQYPSN